MNKNIIISIAVFVILIVLIVLFLYLRGDSTSDRTVKSLVYDRTLLTKSKNLIYTSNYDDKILYLTSTGLWEYDIIEKKSTQLNTRTDIKGLAFDKQSNNYIVLDATGILYHLSSDGTMTEFDDLRSTDSKLYDTENGYYIYVDGLVNYVGGYSPKVIDEYGNIMLSIS